MGRSLGLTAYRALSRRKASPTAAAVDPRPKGELVWAHATTTTRYAALCDLGARLKAQRIGVMILITVDPSGFDEVPAKLDGCDKVVALQEDHPDEAQNFIAHWMPDICLWTGGELMPNLIAEAHAAGIPMILLDVDADAFSARLLRWLPDIKRSSLGCFDRIMVTGRAAADAAQKLGVPRARIEIASPLRYSASPSPCDEFDLMHLHGQMAGRPVWLSAQTQLDELEVILNAHRSAIRLAHRLLLVIHLPNLAEDATARSMLANSGLRHTDWQPDTPVEDNTQVLMIHSDSDLGLWYRAAPLTLMASSLTDRFTGTSPMEAAALGSALLYGPHVKGHAEAYAKLSRAGAALAVKDQESLGQQVILLIAPDQAATMALAGWDLVTEGAELMDRLLDLVQDSLDLKEAANARS